MELQVYKAQIDPSPTSDLEVNFIGLVDRPAIERNFLAFNEHKNKVQFAINEEDRVLVGPAMIADMPLYRKDDQLGEYFVVFDKAAINSIVEKFHSKGYLKNFNLFHDAQQQMEDITILSSFITSEKYGIKAPELFKDIADGSWFISVKINNEQVWQKVKSGEIRGFSVEGIFGYVPVQRVKMSAEQAAEKIRKFLNETVIE